tara:strand:+ start:38 stop:406 length:369 start_codon:yes stop_codon:yes gene_type:complete
MKLSIDTKEDSHDDLRKVIKMLQHLVGESSYSNYSNESSSKNIFDDPSPGLGSSEESAPALGSSETAVGGEQNAALTNAFSAMFGGEAPAPVESSENESMSTYGEDEVDDRKLDLDEEIVPY